MKKSILIVFFFNLICANYSQAQQYYPFPTSNAFWRVDWAGMPCFPPPFDNTGHYQYVITGDTVINALTYHKIIRSGYPGCNAEPFMGTSPNGAFRNDTLNKKVFFISADSTNEALLYDFNLTIGDTVHGYLENIAQAMMGPTYCAVIDSVDSVLINSSYRKRWKFKPYLFNTPNNWDGYIIEGIGNTLGLLEGFLNRFESNGHLICYSENGVPLYGSSPCETVSVNAINKNKYGISLFPNPISEKQDIELAFEPKYNFDKTDVKIFNLHGQLINFNYTIFENKILIDASRFNSGIYLIQIFNSSKIIYQNKILKL